MSKNPKIKKVVIIGSGPIIIGQAAERKRVVQFAKRALKSSSSIPTRRQL